MYVISIFYVNILESYRYIFLSIAEMGDSFRDAAWDNQLDTMLDDLQASVQAGGSETHGYKNGYHSANGGKIFILLYINIIS